MGNTTAKVWTVLDIIKWSENFLKQKGFENARTDAELMLMDILSLKRMDLYVNFDRPLTQKERDQMKGYILRRAAQEPVQYITGNTFFMGLPFKVNTDVLIPRFDTEILIDTVLKSIKQYWPNEQLLIIDVGTGSGAIAVALAKYTSAEVIGLDISAQALALAQENAVLNKLAERIEFIESDLLTEIIKRNIDKKILIVSNPPYVTLEEYQQLPVEISKHEPKQALIAQDNGLEYYKKISSQALLLSDKVKGIFFEIGSTQGGAVRKILEEGFQKQVYVVKDLGGNERVVYTICGRGN